MEYLLHILIFIGIYSILSMSLNLVVGYTGMLSIAHAAFYGVGAYVAALMALKLNSPFIINIFCAAIICAVLGLVVGIPSIRIRDEYFFIATFAFQIIIVSIFNNWVSFTGGPMGLSGIPMPTIFRLKYSTDIEYIFLVTCVFIITLWVLTRITHSPFGRVLKAIREDEVFAQSMGKNVAKYKVLSFIMSAVFASMAGSIYAFYVGFIDPTSFTVMESIFILSIVIIGGSGSLWGSVVGSIILVTLPELLRFLGLPSSVAANVRQILYGALLVVFMVWRPNGLLGKYDFYSGISRK
jgi:branched-chain amino acid transport system permease protein